MGGAGGRDGRPSPDTAGPDPGVPGRPPPPGRDGHPSLDIVGSDGSGLSGKRVVLCVSGSVAAYKAIELARLLMRHGADVTCVASGAATRLIRPDYFRWATGRRAVTRLTGDLEHIGLADHGRSDVIVAYPSTANTLGKLANGIDDTPVSTTLAAGLGSGTPIVAALAMHRSMYDNPAVARNVEFLRGRVDFVEPEIAEGKAKVAEPGRLLEHILGRFGSRRPKLRGKRVLIAAGPTAEPIDPVRAITNASTGRTGVLLASEMLAGGADVTMVYGPGREAPPAAARVVHVKTTGEMDRAVMSELKAGYDVVVMAAAAADYAPARALRTKIRSGRRGVSVSLKPVPKILGRIRGARAGVFLVGFKAEAGVSKKELERRARRRLKESGADLIVANDVGDPRYARDPSHNEVLVVDAGGARSSGWRRKEEIAGMITGEIEARMA